MNIYISGSMAYDRIMDFPGSFADYILPEKIHVLNVCFNVNEPAGKVRRHCGEYRLFTRVYWASGRSSSRLSARTTASISPGSSKTVSLLKGSKLSRRSLLQALTSPRTSPTTR